MNIPIFFVFFFFFFFRRTTSPCASDNETPIADPFRQRFGQRPPHRCPALLDAHRGVLCRVRPHSSGLNSSGRSQICGGSAHAAWTPSSGSSHLCTPSTSAPPSRPLGESTPEGGVERWLAATAGPGRPAAVAPSLVETRRPAKATKPAVLPEIRRPHLRSCPDFRSLPAAPAAADTWLPWELAMDRALESPLRRFLVGRAGAAHDR
eukprot:scaffold228_cov312-Pinguiococcus_pyrenoidosus.AAC.15